ncbi:MAG: hypothetical protein NZ553_05870, partial [Caldilinea sp.]|nr:hypothetical protein [Caldilinea sp.]MDW8439986.1 putative PEP-binding protein [Caldilineaceae bacterium]
SIGTNDLAQYIMAADRNNAAVASLVSAYQPAVLRAIRETVEAGRAAGIKVSLCGEMAGDPKATALLIGLGIDALSMSPAAIPLVKERIRRLDMAEAKRIAALALEMSSAEEIEAYLSDVEQIDLAAKRMERES